MFVCVRNRLTIQFDVWPEQRGAQVGPGTPKPTRTGFHTESYAAAAAEAGTEKLERSAPTKNN